MHRHAVLRLIALALVCGCEAPDDALDPSADVRPGDDGPVDAAPLDGEPAADAEPEVDAEPDPDADRPGDAAPPDRGPPIDAAPDPDTGPTAVGDGCEVLPLLARRCANGGCHLPNNRRTSLVLTHEAMAAGSLAGYVVPFEPDDSYLITRMRGHDAGPLMPLGTLAPIDELPLIEAWVADGAPTACDQPLLEAPSDPNHLDRDALFVCEGAASATPARLRRVERREWTRAVVKPLSGTWWGSTAKDNPFAAPDRLPYSTYPADVTLDPATLDLYLLVLPEAPALWNARDPVRGGDGFIPGVRTQIGYRNPAIRCIFDDPAPDDGCLDTYVTTLLEHGVLFRPPTEGEHGRLRAFLAQALADEADPTQRRATLQYVGEAAFLMAGALFRPELGEAVPDAPGRRRLTADEMGLALGRVLSAHPVGAPLPIDVETPPDADLPLLGRLAAIKAAALDGSIFDPAVIAALLEAYRGGVDPARPDIAADVDGRALPLRGDYWLAENIQQFFREWLDYAPANTAFKDTPGATSRWDGTYDGDPMWDPTTTSYRTLQSGNPGYESTLVDQLDDTIARAVIESHEQGDDVFARLMTTRLWRLPSDRSNLSDVVCDDNADCAAPNPRCIQGLCGSSIASTMVNITRVYGLDDTVPHSEEGRWVEMPPEQRAGVLTHPAWLAAHGGNFEDDANTVYRGHWIRERLFCETIPGLEFVQAEAKLVASEPTVSARERLHRSIEDPEHNPQSPICMGCHSLMNSLGYPFEIYNHAGFVRAFDHGPDGPVDPDGSTTLRWAPEPALDRDFADAIELVEALAESREARRCFIRQVFRYFAGRDETPADACVLADMEAALDETGSFFAMLEVLVQSDAFQDRTPPEVP